MVVAYIIVSVWILSAHCMVLVIARKKSTSCNTIVEYDGIATRTILVLLTDSVCEAMFHSRGLLYEQVVALSL